MKRIVLAVAAALAAAGCGSLQAPGRAAFEVDSDKVAVIEQAARKSGVQVVWVNMPMRRVGQ